MADGGMVALRDALGKILEQDHPDLLREGVALLYRELMEAEVAAQAGAALYERSEDRVVYRAGRAPLRPGGRDDDGPHHAVADPRTAALEAREPMGTIFTRYTISNARFVQLIGAALVLALLVTSLEPLQRIFGTVELTSRQWGICLLGPIAFIAVAEAAKLLDRHLGRVRRAPWRGIRMRHR
jgi:hypothetical protein